MDNVRLRRLKADYEALRRLARLHPRIDIEGVVGNPPERYRIHLKVKSLREKGEAIETVTDHWLEVSMPRGYPRDAPLFRMLTPVFHPNIAPHAVCIGDDWTAGEPIEHLIQRVGEILAFQSYNTKSPLNGRAAQWVDEHRDQLPIDREEFFLDLSAEPEAAPTAAAAEACSNCGGTAGPIVSCGASHRMCADCTVRCKTCGALLCLSCGTRACAACAGGAATAGTAATLAQPLATAPTAAATPSPFARPAAAPAPYAAAPSPYAPQPSPYAAAPSPYAPQPASPYAAPSPYAPQPASPYAAPSPYAPQPASPYAPQPTSAVTRCQSCNILLGPRVVTCPAGHRTCGDCAAPCRTCGQVLCLVCGTFPCRTCAARTA